MAGSDKVDNENQETFAIDSENDGVLTESLAVESQSITLADLQEVRNDLVHTDLFGTFVLLGALVASVIFQRWIK